MLKIATIVLLIFLPIKLSEKSKCCIFVAYFRRMGLLISFTNSFNSDLGSRASFAAICIQKFSKTNLVFYSSMIYDVGLIAISYTDSATQIGYLVSNTLFQ